MTITPDIRKLLLTAHVTTSVGWVGAVLGFLALVAVALTSADLANVRSAVVAMGWTLSYAIVPLSVASVVVGIAQSLASPWGLIRYWWVVVKIGLTLVATAIVLAYGGTMGDISARAAEGSSTLAELKALALSPLIHAGGGLVVLVTATVLSVYKPAGLTPYGWRRREEQRTAMLIR